MKLSPPNWLWLAPVLFWLLFDADALFSQDNVRIAIPRLKSPITLDGLSDEPAWQGIAPFSFIQFEPNFGKEPTERTEVLAAYDENYLFIAGRLYDREPSRIQANSKQRDSVDASSDWFVVVIDSFNDKENALAFATTPSGLRWDAAVFNDAHGLEPLNFSWNTFWDVAVARNDDGWFVEMRIPFSSLRFQDANGRVVMGMISWRSIARKNEYVVFPKIAPDWGFWGKFKPSLAREVVLEDIHSRSPLYVAPYVLGGLGQSFELDKARTVYRRVDNPAREAGLDVKYGLTSNLTLDLTLNTDFAQVEADNQLVNLTRFSLYFPEKRLFFQERASIFDFDFESFEPNRLFYSRRIGIQEGRLVRIYGGARLVGRLGPWDMGFLDMQTARVDGHPSENFGVFRMRRQVFNSYSYIGGIVTSRIGMDGSFNSAYGLDSVVRLFGDDYLTVKWAQTFENGYKNAPLSLDPARFFVRWQRRNQKGLSGGLSYARVGNDYNPGMGFEMRHDYSRFVGGLLYGWFPGDASPIFNHQAFLNGFFCWRNADRSLEYIEIDPGWKIDTKSGFSAAIGPKFFIDNIPENFSLSEKVNVPKGLYRYWGLNATLATPGGKPLQAQSVFDAGSFYDGRRISLSVAPSWYVSSDLELSGFYEFDRVAFPVRSQGMAAHIARIKALYMLSTRFSASAFIQFNSAANAVIANVRLRYNPREGVDVYLVYNEGLNTRRYRESPALPFSSGRTVMLKCTYTFVL